MDGGGRACHFARNGGLRPGLGILQGMYAPFFGLSKEPFSIAPDPRFLFMSDMHREALAHLLYGVSGGGGFVLLTGEVGAGKTTVCRAFLEQVPPQCTVAYIFNPRLTVAELLQTVCDEFGIAQPPPTHGAGAPSVKDYVDALNQFLLAAHAAGAHTVLIIDEAQNLAPDVLEQLRLLTNLETSERKLLQIVLIGQPELRDMLARPELEQLAQRVIARYHLPALSAAETAQYIQHRLAVAGPAARAPFDARTLARIHTLSAGVPRRINLLCDRALLGAYAHGQHEVVRETVEQAAREVFGPPRSAKGDTARPGRLAALGPGWKPWALAGSMLLSGLLLLALLEAWLWPSKMRLANEPAAVAAAAGAVAAAAPVAAAAVPTLPGRPLPAPLADAALVLAAAVPAQDAAWRELAPLWQATLAPGDACAQTAVSGLACFRVTNGLAAVRQLGRPGLLVLRDDAGAPVFVRLLALGPTDATLAAGQRQWRLPLAALARIWRGEFATFWRPPPGWRDGPDAGAVAASQPWLQQRLAAEAADDPRAPLRERVRMFQVAQGLQPDGLAGPMTLMLLSRGDGPRLPVEP